MLISKQARNWLVALPLLSFGLLPLLWYRPGFLLSFEESYLTNYTVVWDKYRQLWSTHLNGGFLHANYPKLFPAGLYWYLLSFLKVSPLLIQVSFFCLAWVAIAVATYFCLSLYTRRPFLRLVGVSLYLLNFYVSTTIFYSAMAWQLFLLPALFFLTTKHLETKKGGYAWGHWLTLFLAQAIFTNPAQAASTLLVYPVIVLLALLRRPTSKRQLVLRLLPILISAAFITTFNLWLYSLTFNQAEVDALLDRGTFQALGSDLKSVIQLRGSWAEEASFQGLVYHPEATYYQKLVIVVIAYLIFFFPLLSLWVRPRSRAYLGWVIILVVGLFLATGTAPPGGKLYAWLFDRIPYFKAFREPWAKFMPWVVFSVSLLNVITLDRLAERLPRFSQVLLPFFWLLVLLRGLPFLTGAVIDHQPIGWKRVDAQIPDYWWQARRWSLQNQGANLFLLPQPVTTTRNHYFFWYPQQPGNYKGPLPSVLLSANLLWNRGDYLSRNDGFSTFIRYFHPSVFNLLNTDYILAMNDVRPTSFSDLRLTPAQSFLEGTPQLEFGGGKLQLYAPQDKKDALFTVPTTSVFYYGQAVHLGASPVLTEPAFPFVIKANRPVSEITPDDPLVISVVATQKKDYQEGVVVPRSGTYNLYLPPQAPAVSQIRLGKHSLTAPQTEDRYADWQNLGTLQLEEGRLQLGVDFTLEMEIAQEEVNKLLPEEEPPPDWQGLVGKSPEPIYYVNPKPWQPATRYEVTVTYQGEPGLFLLEEVVDWENADQPQRYLDVQELPKLTQISSQQSLKGSIDAPTSVSLQVASGNFATAAWLVFRNNHPSASLAITDVIVNPIPLEVPIFLTQKSLLTETEVTPPPRLSYEKIGPAKYRVSLETLPKEEEWDLVFAQSFHPGWVLYLPQTSRGLLNQPPSLASEHFAANGLANGWRLSPQDYGKDQKLELVVEFWPQRIYSLGTSLISLAALVSLWQLGRLLLSKAGKRGRALKTP